MIPNIFHYISGLSEDFGGKPFSFVHYIAIESARVLNKPEKIFFICEFEPTGVWFEKIKPHIEIVKIVAPTQIFGNPLHNYAHKSDVIRLEFLTQHGGVYLDIDTICARPIAKLLNSAPFVMGAEFAPSSSRKINIKRKLHELNLYPWQNLCVTGLCNAVLMANKNSSFLKDWYNNYANFNGESLAHNWNHHSVLLPFEMYNSHKYEINVLSPYAFHYPLWDPLGMSMLFERNINFRGAYLHHLWESYSWEKYLKHITPSTIMARKTTYNNLARKFSLNTHSTTL